MKAIYALIPAALLAGTVLSGAVEARGTADFGISKQDYFKVMNAKRLGKINKVRSLKAHKKAAAAGKATKKDLKTVGLKQRKKLAKAAVADKKPKTVSVATPKQDEVKPQEITRLEPASMSKVLRSGPREMKSIILGDALQISEASEVRKTVSVATPKQDEIKPQEIARLEPASMSKVLRSGPREVKSIISGDALQVSEASEVRKAVSVATSRQDEIEPHEIESHKIARLEPASMSKVLRSGPREVKNVMLDEALQVSGTSEVRKIVSITTSKQDGIEPPKIARLDPASLSKVPRSGPREVESMKLGETLQVSEDSEVRIAEMIREIAPSYGVPTWFALRIAEVESGYDPYARGRAGEIGVYQLKCQTARGMGFEGDCSNLTDAHTNVRWGLKHLSRAIALSGGNLRLAASKHNAGLSHKSLVHSYIAKVF